MAVIAELRRRNVFRVAAAYVVSAWLIVQVADTLAPAFELDSWVVRVTVLVLAIGFVPAVVLAWVFELTPEGIKLDADTDSETAPASTSVKRLDRAIIVLLTVAVAYFAIDKFVVDPARDAAMQAEVAEKARQEALAASPADPAIAVLSFDNQSDDTANEFLAAGISENVLSRLSLVPRLRVISGYSSFSVKEQAQSIADISERLNATWLVDGSVRRFGEQLKVSARLIDARTDSLLWAEEFIHVRDDPLAMESLISAAVVDALRSELGADIGVVPESGARPVPVAHEAYLRGRLLVRQRTPSAIGRAIEEFDAAVELDPDYALAHAELAIAIALGGQFVPDDEAQQQRARFHARRAYELDPELAESNAARAWFSESGETKLRMLHRAVELNPNYSDAWYWLYALGSTPMGLEEGFQALENAVRIDPLSQPASWDYVLALIARNRVDQAAIQIHKHESLDPRGAILLRGVLESLGGNASAWFLAYLEAASAGTEELMFGNLIGWQWKWQLERLGLIEEMLARQRQGDMMDLEFEVYFGDAEKAIEQARQMVDRDPEAWFERMRLGLYLAHVGELAEARPYLELGWKSLDGPNYLKSRNDFNSAALAESLIAARRDGNDTVGAEEILAIWKEGIKRHRAAGVTATFHSFYSIDYHDGVVAWLEGDRERSLGLLRRAVDDGFSLAPPSEFQRDRYNDPEFAALFERQAQIQARERRKVLSVVCNDNPYAEVWQPMDVTCERYREETQ
jgi:TolB-like protein